MRIRYLAALAVAATGLGLAACSAPSTPAASVAPPSAGAVATQDAAAAAPTGAVAPESAVPAEKNPPGDIPDNQAFVPIKTAGGFTVKVPEGWSRSDLATSAIVTDKLNTIQVAWRAASSAPTVASARSVDVPALQAAGGAFQLVGVTSKKLPAGEAVVITYRVNSAPNDVTGKRYRLDVERYELFHAGTRVDLTLLSPVGADNVDPWRIVTESLTW